MPNNLLDSLKKSFSKDNKKLAVEYSEIALDAISESEIIKQIPILKTMVGILEFSNNISRNFELKKIINFLGEQSDDTDTEKIIDSITSHNDYTIHVEEIILILSRQDSVDKAKIIGKIFKSLLERKIKRNDFLLMSSIVEKSILSDLNFLKGYRSTFIDIGDNVNPKNVSVNRYRSNENLEIIHRLQNTGLLLSKPYLAENKEKNKEIEGTYYVVENIICSPTGDKIIKFL